MSRRARQNCFALAVRREERALLELQEVEFDYDKYRQKRVRSSDALRESAKTAAGGATLSVASPYTSIYTLFFLS